MSREKIVDSLFLPTDEASAYCKVARSTLWRAVKVGRPTSVM
jgi:predicted DNA-binding protein (UPF0251 family)